MTSQGHPLSVLRRAIKTGNLQSVELALIDVPAVGLEDALEILTLMPADDDRRAAWCERWAQRVATAQHNAATRHLQQLPDPRALEQLRTLARSLRGASVAL